MRIIFPIKNLVFRKTANLIVLLLLLTIQSRAQNTTTSGTEFWFGFMENLSPAFNGSPKFSIQIRSLSGPTEININIPGRNYVFKFTVDDIRVVDLPSFDLETRSSGIISDLGIQVTSDKPIEVVAIHNRAFFSATTRLFPVASLSSDYLILAAEDDFNRSPSSVLVVATSDNTEITLCLPPCGTRGSFSFKLNKGETFQYQSLDDLSGTEIKANRTIAVFSGAKQATFIDGDDSHVYFAHPPKEFADTFYILVPNDKIENKTYYKVLALENSTIVKYGNTTLDLDKGQTTRFKLSQPLKLISSKPVFIGQFNSGSTSGQNIGPSMVIVQSPSSSINQAKFITKEDFGGSRLIHAITLVTKDTSGVLINNKSETQFNTIPDTDYFYLTKGISSGTYEILLQSGFIGQVYGASLAEYYSFSMGYESATKDIPSGTNQILDCNGWQISPTLNTGSFRLNAVNNSIIEFEKVAIYNSKGQFICDLKTVNTTDLSFTIDVAPGVYYLKLHNCSKAKKFIVHTRN